jgi:hypothetical protein
MTAEEAVDIFASLPRAKQIAVLVNHAFQLTILARDSYASAADSPADAPALRELNEIQHRTLGHLSALLANTSERYTDDVIARIAIGGEESRLLELFAASIRQIS